MPRRRKPSAVPPQRELPSPAPTAARGTGRGSPGAAPPGGPRASHTATAVRVRRRLQSAPPPAAPSRQEAPGPGKGSPATAGTARTLPGGTRRRRRREGGGGRRWGRGARVSSRSPTRGATRDESGASFTEVVHSNNVSTKTMMPRKERRQHYYKKSPSRGSSRKSPSRGGGFSSGKSMKAQLLSHQAPALRLPLLFLLLCFFPALLHFVSTEADAAPTLVTTLPGFDGALPFRLETGYVTVEEENGAELFYYFIESEGDPRRDPVVLWLTGGDRCTVLSALFFEIGPLKFITEPYYNQNGTVPRLRYHPYSWTKVASVLFVDSPVGAGFSFSTNPRGYDVGDVSSSLQLKKFLSKWFTEHPNYLENPFYVGGDSYGGKLVPFLAQKISEDIEDGLRPVINLKGYLVGNPGTGESIDLESRVPFLHGVGIISDQLYETIKEHCQAGDLFNPKNVLCAQALDKYNRLYDEISQAHILYKKCVYVSPRPKDETTDRKILKEEIGVLKNSPPRPPMDCQTYGNYLSYFWANNNITRETLGIKKGSKDEWVRCHNGDLPYYKDIKSNIKYHNNMTTKGFRLLVYSGDHDALVPFLGTQSWVRSLNFPVVDEWRAWHLDGQSAGFTITYTNNLTFATIKGGGHTAPEYQPERCLAMFSRWISGVPL